MSDKSAPVRFPRIEGCASGLARGLREQPPARRAGQDVARCGTLCAVIKSFADKRTAAIFAGLRPKGTPADVANAARRKLAMIDRALDLGDLRSPPGNRLEALKGDRQGSTACALTPDGGCVFAGQIAAPKTSSSATTIEGRHDHPPRKPRSRPSSVRSIAAAASRIKD
jgi:plasmid maintenance system killer protein